MGDSAKSGFGKAASYFERNVIVRLMGLPFTATSALSRWEVYGAENLRQAVEESWLTGRGLVTASNHVSLFDDPLVLVKLLGIHDLKTERKTWWSTACASNFNPAGSGFKAACVRYFSRASNMIFLSRAGKRRGAPPPVARDPLGCLSGRIDDEGMEALAAKAARDGLDLSSWLKGFLTAGEDGIDGTTATLNQEGIVEAIARVATGGWVHLFPEGGRSRSLSLRNPRTGAGKVVYHAKGCIVVPICLYGTQDIMPVGALLPRPFRKIVVSVGEPVPAARLDQVREKPATVAVFNEMSRAVMDDIYALRAFVLERYAGTAVASEILLDEARRAAAGDMGDEDVFVASFVHRPARRAAAAARPKPPEVRTAV